MDESQLRQSRISRIETLWSVVRQAHDDNREISVTAQEKLLEIYGGAIKRYLLTALRDENVAHDLYQEFALKLTKGDFQNTTPDKGKFRFYVKTVVRNLIRSHFRKQNRNPTTDIPLQDLGVAQEETSDQREDQMFSESWRDDLLFRTWQSLAEHQQKTGAAYYTILNLRVVNPELNGDEFAEKLSSEIGRPVRPATARVQLHRAREKFASLLIDDVSNSLENNSRENVEQELIELGLMEYCRPAFESYQDED
ncbi:MAG: RNA polymerase sigma factor [Mariniblastus sp.]